MAQELQNSLPLHFRDRYHRMNIEFYGDEPELDDLKAIPSLQHQAYFHAVSSDDIRKCADNVLASFFLSRAKRVPPSLIVQLRICRGTIRCRLGPLHKGLQELAKHLKDDQARFYLDFQQAVPCLDAGNVSEH